MTSYDSGYGAKKFFNDGVDKIGYASMRDYNFMS